MGDEGARILKLVAEQRFEEALGLGLGAPRDVIARTHLKLLHRFRAEPLVREALNRARNVLGAETDGERARRLVATGRLHEAIGFLEKALQTRRTAADHHLLGCVLSKLSRHEQALEQFSQAMALRGDYTDRQWMGRTLDSLGRHQEALEHFSVLVTERGSALDHHFVGLTLMGLERHEEALLHLSRACSIGDDPMDQHLAQVCAQKLGERPVRPGVVARITGFFAGIVGERSKT